MKGARSRHTRSVGAALILGAAATGCVILVDFDDYKTAGNRALANTNTDAAPAEPFVITSVTPQVVSGRSGEKVPLTVRLERRLGFAGTIAFGLTNARGMQLESPLLKEDTAVLTLVVGTTQGRFDFELTATSPEAPGYTARVALQADVRGAPGTFDVSFGDGGVVDLALFKNVDDVVALDKKIVVSGRGVRTAEGSDPLTVERLDETGAADPGFGLDAGVLPLANASSVDFNTCVRNAAGATFVAAATLPPGFRVYRLDVNGRLDASYGDGGASLALAQTEPCHGLVVDERGTLFVGGSAMGRLTLSGAPDVGFADAGTVPFSFARPLFAGTDDAGTIDLLTTTSSGLAHQRFSAVGAPLDPDATSPSGLPKGGCKSAPRSALRTTNGRVFAQLDCAADPIEPQYVATLLAFTGASLDPSFNQGAPLAGPERSHALALTSSAQGLIALSERQGSEPTIVTARTFDGTLRWEIRSSTLPPSLNLAVTAATADAQGRVLLVGSRGPNGFIARVWD